MKHRGYLALTAFLLASHLSSDVARAQQNSLIDDDTWVGRSDDVDQHDSDNGNKKDDDDHFEIQRRGSLNYTPNPDYFKNNDALKYQTVGRDERKRIGIISSEKDRSIMKSIQIKKAIADFAVRKLDTTITVATGVYKNKGPKKILSEIIEKHISDIIDFENAKDIEPYSGGINKTLLEPLWIAISEKINQEYLSKGYTNFDKLLIDLEESKIRERRVIKEIWRSTDYMKERHLIEKRAKKHYDYSRDFTRSIYSRRKLPIH